MTIEAPTAAPRDFTGVALRTDRLILRPWSEQDIDAITEACQDPEIHRYVPIPSPYTRANAEEVRPPDRAEGRAAAADVSLSAPSSWRPARRWAPWACTGSKGSARRSVARGRSGTGPPRARAAGVHDGGGARASAAGLSRAWDLARIEWLATAGNEASRRVVEKLGFTREGTLRSYAVFRDQRIDMWIDRVAIRARGASMKQSSPNVFGTLRTRRIVSRDPLRYLTMLRNDRIDLRVLSIYEGFFSGGARILHSDVLSGLHARRGQQHSLLSIHGEMRCARPPSSRCTRTSCYRRLVNRASR